MRSPWLMFSDHDRSAFLSAEAFLRGRLQDRETVEWALSLEPNDVPQRMAVLELLDRSGGDEIDQPWLDAWRLIEESWGNSDLGGVGQLGPYEAQKRIRVGDRSGALIEFIVKLVRPRISVEVHSRPLLDLQNPRRRPKSTAALFHTKLTTWSTIDPATLEFETISDGLFLEALARALDAHIMGTLVTAKRLGWKVRHNLFLLGGLNRVYHHTRADDDGGPTVEVDDFHGGIAPAVKVLFATLSRLVDVERSIAIDLIQPWKNSESPVHVRLWAALARDPVVASGTDVAAWLMGLGSEQYWDLHSYPEIAELRAHRFGDFASSQKRRIAARLRKRPPRRFWPKKAESDPVDNARSYWAVRELRRIAIGGAVLSKTDSDWLDSRISAFPELQQMVRIDDGFPGHVAASMVAQVPDGRYDVLSGLDRLNALEEALTTGRRSWDEDPARRAIAWIEAIGSVPKILDDLAVLADGGAGYPALWERLGWHWSPEKAKGEGSEWCNPTAEGKRVFSLLAKLPSEVLRASINGLSHCIASWAEHALLDGAGVSVWFRMWPIAVQVTNDQQPAEDVIRLDVVVGSPGERDPMDLDTYNTPVGRLLSAFLSACPNLQEVPAPFAEGTTLRSIRDAAISATGRSGLIVLHRMIEHVLYFQRAEADWAKDRLIAPLLEDGDEATPLWRAISRRPLSTEILRIIGNTVLNRATDDRLGRESRKSLVFTLIVECLHSLKDQREPAIRYSDVLQMIRCLDDEVRCRAADAISQFVRELSGGDPENGALLFRAAAAPFLRDVWPQERSLSTPGLSKALADLPTAAGKAFDEAVDAIKRFLVPFDCWSLHDYGFFRTIEDRPGLSIVDSPRKAEALVTLLDRTIGKRETSVVPYDLAEALDQARTIEPNVERRNDFRRLAAAARRR